MSRFQEAGRHACHQCRNINDQIAYAAVAPNLVSFPREFDMFNLAKPILGTGIGAVPFARALPKGSACCL